MCFGGCVASREEAFQYIVLSILHMIPNKEAVYNMTNGCLIDFVVCLLVSEFGNVKLPRVCDVRSG